jgi:acetoin utilization deacetylase AcuC-like enzyme
MRRTGIFYHELCRENDIDWLLKGRLCNFPSLLKDKGLLDEPNILFQQSPPAPLNLLEKVHSGKMIREVKKSSYYETALYSTGGTVKASECIAIGEMDNAFVFTGSADHHAGRDYFWGGCHFNGAALAIGHLREMNGWKRFAIIDTDHHHGDGTRDIFLRDRDLLQLCFCSKSEVSADSTKIDVKVPYPCSDEGYLNLVKGAITRWLIPFKPEMIFWEFGYDTTLGDYGDIGLSKEVHVRLLELIKEAAENVCEGKLVVILCGGSSSETIDYCIPKMIGQMGELEKYF